MKNIEDDPYVLAAYHDSCEYMDGVYAASVAIDNITYRGDKMLNSLASAYENEQFEYVSHYVNAVRQTCGLVSRAILETIAQKGALR